ncbi:MAG: LemA family protein [Bacteroidota bacterium]
MKTGLLVALIVVGLLILFGLGIIMWGTGIYNNFVQQDEGIKGAWSQVENQYQRRFDLIPNLVETVKGFASQEQKVLIGVTEARAKVGQMKVTPEVLNNPQNFKQFQQAQDNLSGALSRLMVVVEQYPQLKSDKNFLELQAQLEGTENRIAVERKRYNEVVQTYNTSVRVFPRSMIAGMFGFQQKPYFESETGAENAPKVNFQ